MIDPGPVTMPRLQFEGNTLIATAQTHRCRLRAWDR